MFGRLIHPRADAAHQKLNALLVDDYASVRAGLTNILTERRPVHIFEACGEVDALWVANRMRLDLAIVETRLGGRTATGLIKSLVERHPALRILVLSSRSDDAAIKSALEEGAHGFISKSGSIEELRRAIDAVACGGRYLGWATNLH